MAGFKVRVGDQVLETDIPAEQVLSLSVRTAQGESAALGVQNLDSAEVVIQTESNLVPNLLQVERDQRRKNQEFAKEHAADGDQTNVSFSASKVENVEPREEAPGSTGSESGVPKTPNDTPNPDSDEEDLNLFNS